MKLFSNREEGQGLVEYALILVLVAIVVIAILLQLGPILSQTFCKVTNVLQPGTCDAGEITVISTTVNDQSGIGAGPWDVSVTVQVVQNANVTLTIGGSSSAATPCNTTCTVTTTTTSGGSGNYTISATGLGSMGGAY